MTLNNEKTKKIIYFLSVLILSAVAIIPYLVYMAILFGFEPDYKGEEFIRTIFINSFAFQIFYFFCYSTIFNLYPLNKKVILLSFLSFLLIFLIWHSLNYLIPIGFLYSTNEELNIPFFQMHIITNIFSFVIFFILACLSYNKFIINDIKNINKFFTLTGNTIIFSLIIYFILIIIWILYTLLFSIMIKIFDFELNGNLEMFLFFKIPIIIFILLCGVAPFISYILFSTFKKLENISIYFARGIILIFLFLEFTALLGLFSPLLRPYENKFIFIIYNILLVLIAATLFFISPNYKAGVFVKAIYLITPIFSALFNLVVLSATIFRIIEYGITTTKIILLLTNFSILLHLIIISVCNIKSIIKSLKSEKIEIGYDKTVFYIYVYGALAFVVCFIIPIIFKID
ncbi:hypothetical protein [uncultured Brachyspira sp.]|uniref:hypothetical protein n=1 Tax=uncultured Brachyspira sp. TaxID=221953 RepID=UPI00259624B3|nr:hypothetical protein [uncultured Brachyspira sp.]